MTRLAAAVLIVIAAAALGGQAPSVPTFQSQVTYVELVVSVAGADGAFVPGLAKDDFEVFEDGEGQTIESLSIVDLASERAAAGAATPLAEPDVRSNERPFTGRVWVLALDAANTPADRTPKVRQIASQFIERALGPDDLMAIVTIGDASGAYQTLTGDRRLLLDSLGGFLGERAPVPESIEQPSSRIAATQPGKPTPDMPDTGSLEIEQQGSGLKTMRKLRTIADWAASVHGRRKSLVWLSEGISYDVTKLFSADRIDASGLGASMLALQIRDTAGAITRADVSIYAIDTAGLTVESAVQDLGRWLAQSNLRLLAESTGGFALSNSNNYADAFDRIVRENSSYYVLTYSPAEARQRDGRYHRIRVRVKLPGVTARTRDGYLSPRDRSEPPLLVPIEGLSPELKSVLQSPIPVSGLPLRVHAVPFKGEGANASVLIAGEIPGSALVSSGDVRLQVSYAAIDAAPAVKASATLGTELAAGSPARMQAEQAGLGFQRRIVLAPGRYQLRVGARDAGRGLAGSVLYDLDVPDYAAGDLAMSGLVLAVQGPAPQPTLSPDEPLQAQLGAPPTVQRRFSRSDREAIVYAEIYDRDGAGRDLDLAVTLHARDGTTVFEDSDRRGAPDARIDGGTHRYSVQIPLEDVPPGEYRLTVSASSRGVGGGTVARAVAITIAE